MCIRDSTNPINVKKGQKLYFRLHHNPIAENAELDWDPEIHYLSISGKQLNTAGGVSNEEDATGENPYSSKYSDGFVLSHEEFVQLPTNNQSGSSTIDWPAVHIGDLDNDLYFRILSYRMDAGNPFDIYNARDIAFDPENIDPSTSLGDVKIEFGQFVSKDEVNVTMTAPPGLSITHGDDDILSLIHI